MKAYLIRRAIQRCTTTEINLVGFGINRAVYLNGELVLNKLSYKQRKLHPTNGFNWGYHGKEPAQLSLAILSKLFTEPIGVELMDKFMETFTAHLPSMSFEADIKIKRWLELLLMDAEKKNRPLIDVQELMKIKGNSFIVQEPAFSGQKINQS